MSYLRSAAAPRQFPNATRQTARASKCTPASRRSRRKTDASDRRILHAPITRRWYRWHRAPACHSCLCRTSPWPQGSNLRKSEHVSRRCRSTPCTITRRVTSRSSSGPMSHKSLSASSRPAFARSRLIRPRQRRMKPCRLMAPWSSHERRSRPIFNQTVGRFCLNGFAVR